MIVAEEVVTNNLTAIITVGLAILTAICAAFKILWDALMRQIDQKHDASLAHIKSVGERVDVLENELQKSRSNECAQGGGPVPNRICHQLMRRHFLPQTDKTAKTALEKHHG
jgi:hypothetical protein